ncbi:protein lin-52 homolog isoform X2 [Bradysia coprophila]|uniref:protein lin-52 homolog isoform X2 n=1 Tax=Bradysia coprophila TaxID=38358 RepID=UPI00187D7BFE|nr:protein lin-52 homolog isoform X2 [Bradysia coprophila]
MEEDTKSTDSSKKVDGNSEDDPDDLISMEKLDRNSPEVWPEKIPGINYFIAMNNTPSVTSSSQAKGISWAQGLSSEDINAMHQLGALSSTGLIAEIRKLYDQAYDLGIQEAKEMTRGRYLNIFPSTKKK